MSRRTDKLAARMRREQAADGPPRLYTRMVVSVQNIFRKYGSRPDYQAHCTNAIRTLIENGGDAMRQAEWLLTGANVLTQNEMMAGRATHLFMPDNQFCEWLVGCVGGKLERRHAGVLSAAIGGMCGVLHFPEESGRASLLFNIPKHFAENSPEYGHMLLIPSVDTGHSGYYLPLLDAGFEEGGDQPDAFILWYAKLVVGLGMYLDCFPEQMREGPPRGLARRVLYKAGRSVTVGVSDKVRTTGPGVSPHYRSGHFRFLGSEKFVNKRGQVVFIHDTFVKGRAKTVLSPEDSENEKKADNAGD